MLQSARIAHDAAVDAIFDETRCEFTAVAI